MRKNFLFLVVVMLFSIVTLFGQGGTAGPLSWKIENGTLTISGNGKMPNYDINFPYRITSAPWGNYHTAFTTVVIEKGVENIGKFAFLGCNLDSINISGSVTTIGENAFAYCYQLKSVVLPHGVTTIESTVFLEGNLHSITLPSSVTSIEILAFAGNPLSSITNLNPVPLAIDPLVFYGVNTSACTLYVPKGSVAAYQRAEVWKEFNIVEGVDVEELRVESGELRVFPNPATGACSIDMPDEFLYERALTLSVYDASGKLVQQIDVDNNTEIPQLKLDAKANGVYFVVLGNGKKEYRGKVVFN